MAGRSEWEPTPVGTAAARGRKASPHRGEGLTESSVRPSRRSTARARLAAGAPSSGLAVALDDPLVHVAHAGLEVGEHRTDDRVLDGRVHGGADAVPCFVERVAVASFAAVRWFRFDG